MDFCEKRKLNHLIKLVRVKNIYFNAKCLALPPLNGPDDDGDDGLYFKTMSIKAAKACGVVYNN